jgi:hypothetical protein
MDIRIEGAEQQGDYPSLDTSIADMRPVGHVESTLGVIRLPSRAEYDRTELCSGVIEVKDRFGLIAAVNDPGIAAAILKEQDPLVLEATDRLRHFMENLASSDVLRHYRPLSPVGLMQQAVAWKVAEEVDPCVVLMAKYLQDIGFSVSEPDASRVIQDHISETRAILREFDPKNSDLQINIGLAVNQPHYHEDLGILFPYVGAGPVIISDDRSKTISFWAQKRSGFVQHTSLDTRISDVSEGDIVRVPANTFAILKGRKDVSLGWAEQGNRGAVHFSPEPRDSEGFSFKPDRRMLLCHFVNNWGSAAIESV